MRALILLLALALPAASAAAQEAAPTPPQEAAKQEAPKLDAAAQRIEAFYGVLRTCMRDGAKLGLDGRKKLLAPAVAKTYDIPFMAEKALGRHWRGLDQPTRERWVAAFRAMTVATYAARFDGTGTAKLEVQGVEPASRNTAVVHTQIKGDDDEKPVAVHYRMRPTPDGWRIIDVYLNGTVSELALRRSEYASVIERKGLEALMRLIEQRAAGRGEA